MKLSSRLLTIGSGMSTGSNSNSKITMLSWKNNMLTLGQIQDVLKELERLNCIMTWEEHITKIYDNDFLIFQCQSLGGDFYKIDAWVSERIAWQQNPLFPLLQSSFQ